MTRFYVLDVPENGPLAEVAAACADVSVNRIGPYIEIRAAGPIVIDRSATGCRHAVWYSAVAGVSHDSRITQHDKHALRVEPA